MEVNIGTEFSDLGTLTAMIEHSQIIVTAAATNSRHLPAGYEAMDIAVLEWIAAEGRRVRRELARLQ